ncbi:MAG: molybdopterin molybdotransferase MoeA [Pegethrix bostrychoides GSE-TBD4-15B]|jgi:molybdopterin molybdotransferase|uniref:Molybdopterin molybdenumtransferase n=1 Tax=Pegethrix bostrychoides GSE-TBD4-15B TaxID=2839662 RepID=A0A951U5X5_9CYAN|nr:molybdopterin molybdotransferase MoeA [Pegethrix bostrychoides GSE-TBD4-15B]
MLLPQQAEKLILDLVEPLTAQDTETLPLQAANGRILADPVTGRLDIPHWDNSAMDGYAVRHADLLACDAQPVTLEVVEEIPAGYLPQKTLQPGQAARIFTGAMLPPGADTIVMQEETRRDGNQVTVLASPKPQAFVQHQAEFYRAGTLLLPAGIELSAPDIAVIATVQALQVAVYRRPRVAIFSTGDELVTLDQLATNSLLQPGQIVDSNQYALAALVADAGAEPILLGAIPDQPQQIKQTLLQALQTADLILSSGGVSVGDYDYVEQVLAELAADIQIRSVAVKPGKPLTVARFSSPHRALYFGLPGNPVSALVSFWRFVQPALRKLSGRAADWQPSFVSGYTAQRLRADGKRETYFWGQAVFVNGQLQFQLAGGSHSSGNLINLAQTNALAMLPIGQTQIAAGELVQIMLVRTL